MTEALLFLGPAAAMCVLIVAIHVYLGMHILEREVIFVDLSLAQLAVLGAIVATLIDHDGKMVGYIGAFVFTAFGAAVFAVSGRLRHVISQEAVVGFVYAVASAMMVLILSRAPHGAEQIKDALVGSLLVTSWEQVIRVAVVYLVLGAIHWALATRFIRLSWCRENAEQDQGKVISHTGWWDFLFYLLFGVTITISVRVAGVLLVFSYLIVPAMITKLFSTSILWRLIVGWVVAVGVSIAGLASSWIWDLPTGATIVVCFAVALMAAVSCRTVIRCA